MKEPGPVAKLICYVMTDGKAAHLDLVSPFRASISGSANSLA